MKFFVKDVVHDRAFNANIKYSRFTDAAGSAVARIFTERDASSQTKQHKPAGRNSGLADWTKDNIYV